MNAVTEREQKGAYSLLPPPSSRVTNVPGITASIGFMTVESPMETPSPKSIQEGWPLTLARATCSAVMMAGSRKVLVMKAKMINRHMSMKKFSSPGKAARKPAAMPETVVTVVSKMV